MPVYTEKRVVPHTPQQVFDLVRDIETYPHFLPWCIGLRIKRIEEVRGVEAPVADLLVAFKGFRGQYTSRVVADPSSLCIDVEYIDGPFSKLDNNWKFRPSGDGGCEIDFQIDFEFKSRMLQKMISAVFSRAVEKMVEAFVGQAKKIYGEDSREKTNTVEINWLWISESL